MDDDFSAPAVAALIVIGLGSVVAPLATAIVVAAIAGGLIVAGMTRR